MRDITPGLAYVELYVDDDAAVVNHYVDGLLFQCEAVASAATRRSTLLRSNDAQVVVTTPTRLRDPAADYLSRHGDGIADIALAHPDLSALVDQVTGAGLRVLSPIGTVVSTGASPSGRDTSSGVHTARVSGVGSVHHTLLGYDAASLVPPPGFAWSTDQVPPHLRHEATVSPQVTRARPQTIDHLAWCLPAGQLEAAAAHYRQAFGLEIITTEQIAAGVAVTNSYALQTPAAADLPAGTRLTFVLAEPDRALQPFPGGQIDAFVQAHKGGGVQHIALGTDDIITAVDLHSRGGVEFLEPPLAYYDRLPAAVTGHPSVAGRLEEIKNARVLVDRDDAGLLCQVFTASPHAREAVFYELIQRVGGGRGFGSNNVRALFEARERALPVEPAVDANTGS